MVYNYISYKTKTYEDQNVCTFIFLYKILQKYVCYINLLVTLDFRFYYFRSTLLWHISHNYVSSCFHLKKVELLDIEGFIKLVIL